MGQSSCQICHDISSPVGAYERAYILCMKAVMIEKMSTVYIGEALNSLKAKGDFGSWLHNLFHRKKVTIHLHYYERLVRIVEEQAAVNRRQTQHIDDLIKIAKGRRDAFDKGDVQSDLIHRHG